MKIAFVIPWFGQFCFGGAEKEAKFTAINLQKAGVEVEILATCVRDSHSNWNENFYPAGEFEEDGLLIRRFPIKPGHHFNLNKIILRIRLEKQLNTAEEKIFVEENIRSVELNDFIKNNAQNYDFFIYIPYLYGTTIDGSRIAPEKSLLIPCLHDENYARLKIFQEVFNNFRFLIFHTESEKKLAENLYQINPEKKQVLGEGVNTEINFSKNSFKKRHGLVSPHLLWVGRKDEGKNLALLFNYFANFKKVAPGNLKLVLIGQGKIEIPYQLKNEIIDLGYVSEEEKMNAYADALITVQPSLNESFSLVLMESWLAETPVLVNGFCEVTREHCLKSQGGLYFENFQEFVEAVEWFLKNDQKRQKMGQNGRQYVLENFSWPKIIPKYLALFEKFKK